MKTKHLALGILAAGITAAIAAPKDPTIMSVGGVDVPLSEFEYLYNKNSQQQIQPQTLDEYLDRFKVYRMKVAEAIAAGIDTTAQFKNEFEQYRQELAQPYLADSTYINNLARKVYDLGDQEYEVSFILKMAPTPEQAEKNNALLDSLKTLVANGADFNALAQQYSDDRNARVNAGHAGVVSLDRFPMNIADGIVNLKPGEVSDVLEFAQTQQIVRLESKRPNRGQLHISYIVKGCRPDATTEDWTNAKAKIDSIYGVLLESPAKFEEMAIRHSDDKRTGSQGGYIPQWLGAAQLPAAVSKVVFDLPMESISEPIKIANGWMIVKKLNQRERPTFDAQKGEIIAMITNPQDERQALIMEDDNKRLAKKFNAKQEDATVKMMRDYIQANGIDSTFYAQFQDTPNPRVLYTIGKEKHYTPELLKRFYHRSLNNPTTALQAFDGQLTRYYNTLLNNAAIENLAQTEPAYRNLLNEFHDGSLVYEISAKKVYNRASQDTEGLEKYFNEHRGEYKWTKPHVKGYLVQTPNDSIANEVRARLQTLGADTLMRTVRKEFGNEKVQIDRVLRAQGDDPLVDALVFGAPATEPRNSRFATAFMFDAVILNEPSALEDVRGLVTNDYQNQLEQDWVDELKSKYAVTVNEKELNKLRKKK